jgi:hypothetical protein
LLTQLANFAVTVAAKIPTPSPSPPPPTTQTTINNGRNNKSEDDATGYNFGQLYLCMASSLRGIFAYGIYYPLSNASLKRAGK